MFDNIILNTDSYKFTHYVQYPKDTEYVYSYFESRGGAKWNETVFFGLQYFLMKYLAGAVVTQEMVEEAATMAEAHFGSKDLFNYDGWSYIVKTHEGKLPVKIMAVPEGSVIPTGNVLMTIVNTDPKCFWLTNYLETLLVQTWYPCTVATQSREMKKVWKKYLEETGSVEGIDFKLHDFGFRGVSCPEQAALGGAAHLLNFLGSDTFAANVLLARAYGAPMASFSIPASEHSTITSWGKEHEVDAMHNMLTAYKTPLVACVSDSYNIYNACEDIWGGILKQEVIDRGGTLVIRPDSGDPLIVVPEIIHILMDKFGFTINSKGYKVLPGYVRVIQGDGINFASMRQILETLKSQKLSCDNIAMGSGGGLLQQLNRDTQRFAFKCSAICRSGVWRDVYKQPLTDASKDSKRGRLALRRIKGSHGSVYQTTTDFNCADNLLETVFEDGCLRRYQSLRQIRENCKI